MPNDVEREGEGYEEFTRAVDALNDLIESVDATPAEIQRAVQECQYRCGMWLGLLPATERTGL